MKIVNALKENKAMAFLQAAALLQLALLFAYPELLL